MTRIIFIIALMLSGLMANAQTDSIQELTTKELTTKIKKQGHEVTGKATYYGDRYKNTRRTANGEYFNKDAYTAAHKTLPFGTIVKVTNTRNNKSVTVRITDRGPFGPGRIIDVTPKAARDLDMIRAGVVPVELEIISVPEKKETKKSKR